MSSRVPLISKQMMEERNCRSSGPWREVKVNTQKHRCQTASGDITRGTSEAQWPVCNLFQCQRWSKPTWHWHHVCVDSRLLTAGWVFSVSAPPLVPQGYMDHIDYLRYWQQFPLHFSAVIDAHTAFKLIPFHSDVCYFPFCCVNNFNLRLQCR